MADNLSVAGGSSGPVATDEVAGVHFQRVKVTWGVDGVATDVSTSNPLPISDAGGTLTVDNPTLGLTGGGSEASALRVTIANNSSGVLSVDDNGSSLTIDDGGGILSVDDGGGILSVDDGGGVLSIDDNGSSLTTDTAQLPSTLGQKTKAASLGVTIASDQSAIPVFTEAGKVKAVFSYVTTVGMSTATIPVSTSRIRIMLKNVHASATAYIEDDPAVSSSTGWVLAPGAEVAFTDSGTTLYAVPSSFGVSLRIIEEVLA